MVQSLHSPKSSEVKGIINAIQELKVALINIIIAQLLPFLEAGPELIILGKKARLLAPQEFGVADWDEINAQHELPESEYIVAALSKDGVLYYAEWDTRFVPYANFSMNDLLVIEEFTREFPQYDEAQVRYSQTGKED